MVRYLIILFIACNGFYLQAAKHSDSSKFMSYKGLVMTGYQGWFSANGDGMNDGWTHYTREGKFEPGYISIDFWPDMRETSPEERYKTSFKYADGSPAFVFSSNNGKTVQRHFDWMREYGIDGAFMQRFMVTISSDKGTLKMNNILCYALESSEKNHRAISIMYDLSGVNASTPELSDKWFKKFKDDWSNLVDSEIALTRRGSDQCYLYHNGKPLVAIWGLGFNDKRKYDVAFVERLVDYLKNDKEFGGCSVLIGIPTWWREGNRDCVTGEEHERFINLIKKCDIILPWHTGRFIDRKPFADGTYANLIKDDIEWCKLYGKDYTPTISAGFSWRNLRNDPDVRVIAREGGLYFWDMIKTAIANGTEMLYLGMFDEVDEATQLFKIDNKPPVNNIRFLTYIEDGNPEDHYLWLSGEAKRALNGEFNMADGFRKRANADNFLSSVKIEKEDNGYKLNLVNQASNRKIFYADPYSVPDGAPTEGVMIDSVLYKNELADTPASFGSDISGMYIRLVEIDSETKQVLAYKVISFD